MTANAEFRDPCKIGERHACRHAADRCCVMQPQQRSGTIPEMRKFDEGTPPCLDGGVKLERQASHHRQVSLPPSPSLRGALDATLVRVLRTVRRTPWRPAAACGDTKYPGSAITRRRAAVARRFLPGPQSDRSFRCVCTGRGLL